MSRRSACRSSCSTARAPAGWVSALLASACVVAALVAAGCDNGSSGGAGGKASKVGTETAQTDTAGELVAPAPNVVAPALAPPPAPQNPSGPPAIEFANTVHDFGRVPDSGTYRASFAFTNTGGEPLRIQSVTAGCGCTTPSLAKSLYAPGESGTIDVVFNPKGKSDSQPRTLKVLCNAQPENVVELAIHADVIPLLRLNPQFTKFEIVAKGQQQRRTTMFGYSDPDLKIVSLASNNPHVNARVAAMGVTGASENLGTPYSGTIEVTVEPGAPWGTIYATRITVLAQGRYDPQSPPVQAEYTVFVTGDVFGEVFAQPLSGMIKGKNTAIVSMGTLPPDIPFEYAVMITRSKGQPLTLHNAQVSQSTLAGMQARLEQLDASTWKLFFTGHTGSHRGPIQGEITIDCDVSGEGPLRIRYAGSVSE